MPHVLPKTLGILATVGFYLVASSVPLTTCRQIADHVDDKAYEATPFVVTGTVAHAFSENTHHFALTDASGFTRIMMATNAITSGSGIGVGDAVAAEGFLETFWSVATCTNIVFLHRDAPPTIKTVSADDILSGRCDSHIITIRGVVKHIFDDDIDPRFQFLVLDCDGSSVYVTALRKSLANHPLIGATIEVTGHCNPYGNFYRRHIGRSIGIHSFSVLVPATHDPYAVPDIASIRRKGPSEISALGRHRMHGRVSALWGDDLALVRTDAGKLVRVEFAEELRPAVGAAVDVIGHPATDLYNINLTSAYWREAGDPAVAPETPADISVRDWLRVEAGHPCFIPSFHGRPVRLTGVVRSLTREPGNSGLLTLDAEGYAVKVDASANPGILKGVEIGGTVRIGGIAVMDIDNWRPNAALPRIRGFFIVPRSADDVTVLSRPPWLTPRRLLAALAVLLLALAAVLVWNRILRAQVERRSRQLLRERMEGVRSKLKADERTRIAVELHDSLSQNLAGVTFELDAVRNLIHDRDLTMRHLGIASKALASCRREMRDCLWDLRNNALGNGSMNEVIRRSLIPIAGQTRIVVRFDALRSRLSDDLVHAILRIIRELVSNAIRHGKATTVRISGCIDGQSVQFSVRDNGIGFGDVPPPGAEEGHFGLQGVRERARRFKGEMAISRTPRNETRIAVSLRIPEFDFYE